MASSNIITLTTDYGSTDYYQGLLKGSLYKEMPEISLVDISHFINRYDIIHAAYVLKNTAFAFPPGTLHIVDVNNLNIQQVDLLLCAYRNQYFIGPDNGILYMLFEGMPDEAYVLPPDPLGLYNFRMRVSQAAKAFFDKKPIKEIGKRTEKIRERIGLQPVITRDQIRASVIHIDHYENVVLNITKSMFEKTGLGRPFELYYKRSDPITTLSRQYHDVPVGEVLCHFNEAGYLEIAINMGAAAGMLGLQKDTAIQIDFL